MKSLKKLFSRSKPEPTSVGGFEVADAEESSATYGQERPFFDSEESDDDYEDWEIKLSEKLPRECTAAFIAKTVTEKDVAPLRLQYFQDRHDLCSESNASLLILQHLKGTNQDLFDQVYARPEVKLDMWEEDLLDEAPGGQETLLGYLASEHGQHMLPHLKRASWLHDEQGLWAGLVPTSDEEILILDDLVELMDREYWYEDTGNRMDYLDAINSIEHTPKTGARFLQGWKDDTAELHTMLNRSDIDWTERDFRYGILSLPGMFSKLLILEAVCTEEQFTEAMAVLPHPVNLARAFSEVTQDAHGRFFDQSNEYPFSGMELSPQMEQVRDMMRTILTGMGNCVLAERINEVAHTLSDSHRKLAETLMHKRPGCDAHQVCQAVKSHPEPSPAEIALISKVLPEGADDRQMQDILTGVL